MTFYLVFHEPSLLYRTRIEYKLTEMSLNTRWKLCSAINKLSFENWNKNNYIPLTSELNLTQCAQQFSHSEIWVRVSKGKGATNSFMSWQNLWCSLSDVGGVWSLETERMGKLRDRMTRLGNKLVFVLKQLMQKIIMWDVKLFTS